MNPISVLVALNHADGERARKEFPDLDHYRMATSEGSLSLMGGCTVSRVFVTRTACDGFNYKALMNEITVATYPVKDVRFRYE